MTYTEISALTVKLWCLASLRCIELEREKRRERAIDRELQHQLRRWHRGKRWLGWLGWNPPSPTRDTALATLEVTDRESLFGDELTFAAIVFGSQYDRIKEILGLAEMAAERDPDSLIHLSAKDYATIKPFKEA